MATFITHKLTRSDRRNAAGRSIKAALLAVLFTGSVLSVKAQNAAAPPCTLAGRDTVAAGSTATFTLGPCSAASWTVSCGTITAQNANSVTVNFSAAACSTITVAASGGTVGSVRKTASITAAPPMLSGTFATTSQTIGYNKVPVLLQAGPATGGLCGGNYLYQWFSSTDSIHFAIISGGTGQNYQPGALTATAWFYRQASCPASGTVTSNMIKVTVGPPLNAASVSPVSQIINYKAPAAPMTVSIPGRATGISYQWQSAGDPAFATVASIAGATSGSYLPDSLGAPTYYRVLMIAGSDSEYSPPAFINVLPSLYGGNLLPDSQSIAAGSVPELLTCSNVNGGNNIFQFQWYSSPDGNNWTLIPGVQTAGYNPGVLMASTWYQVQVTSNGIPATSTKAVIYVNP